MDLASRLKRLQRYYIGSAALFALLVVAVIVLHSYAKGQEELVRRLTQANHNLQQMRTATHDIRATLQRFSQLFPADRARQSPELLLFARVDEIKAGFPRAETAIGSIEARPDELALVFSVKGTMENYDAFLTSLGQLEGSVLPVVQFRNLVISQEAVQERQEITYLLDGVTKFPQSQTAAPEPAAEPASGQGERRR
jgi:hypothetical protein